MKTRHTLVLLTVALLAVVVRAQDAAPAPAPGVPPAPAKDAKVPDVKDLLAEVRMREQITKPETLESALQDPDVAFTAEQRDKITRIIETARKEREKFLAEHQDEIDKLQAEIKGVRAKLEEEKLKSAPLAKALIEKGLTVGGVLEKVRAVMTDAQKQFFDSKTQGLQHDVRTGIVETPAQQERVEAFLASAEAGFTDEQKAKIREIVAAAREQRAKFLEEHKAEIDQLKADVQAELAAAEEAKLKELAPRIQALLAQTTSVKDLIAQVRATLTDAQKPVFDAKVTDWQQQLRAQGR